MPIQAIILDAGGVLLHERNYHKRHGWEARLGLAQGALTGIVQESGEAALARLGAVAERDVWQAVGRRLGVREEQIAELQRDFWACEELDAPLVECLQSLRPPYKLALLSNAWSDARNFHNTRFGFDQWMDAAVYSAEVGLAKPDPRIYELMLQQLRLPADACIFVDDKRTNVEAAQALGMLGVCYQKSQQAIEDIRSCLRNQQRYR